MLFYLQSSKSEETNRVFCSVFFSGGFLHMRGYDPVLGVLLFSGALALHSRQLDLKLRLDYLWATQVRPNLLSRNLLKVLFGCT